MEALSPCGERVNSESKSAIVKCLLACCAQDLLAVLQSPDESKHYSIPLDFLLLLQYNQQIANDLIKKPTPTLKLFDFAAVEAQEHILQQQQRHSPNTGQGMHMKDMVHVRVHSLPYSFDPMPTEFSPGIGGIRSHHVGRLVPLVGTIVRSGAVQMFEIQRMYECSKCRHRFIVDADVQNWGTVHLPSVCPSKKDRECSNTSFRHVKEIQMHTDYQEVKVQEKMQCMAMGAMPRSITVVLMDDLADSCKSGDEIEVTGVITRRWAFTPPGQRCNVEHISIGNHVRRLNQLHSKSDTTQDMEESFRQFWHDHRHAPLVGRNKILSGICPQICGLFTVKLALALTLIGGVQRGQKQNEEDGGKEGPNVRGEVHMLLIGDPGMGKSQFLKYAARLSERSVMSSGRGTSSAGLTATAVKENGAWSLEAGAMVLADGGICCIDEFDGIKESDRAVIHEAMEQQTLSIAKAGMVTTLSTKTAVLGVMNPKGGRYDAKKTLTENTGLSGPLLSRFDIVLVLLDTRNPLQDESVSSHILTMHQQDSAVNITEGAEWSLDTLKQYIKWAKENIRPVVKPDAERILRAYYQHVRQDGDRQVARSTIRMLESLVRIAQAHARLMARNEVIQQDAVIAVSLVEAAGKVANCLSQDTFSGASSQGDPQEEYQQMEKQVLELIQDETMMDVGGAHRWL